MWFIGVEVEHETSAPPPEKNPGSAPVVLSFSDTPCNHLPTLLFFLFSFFSIFDITSI